MWLTSAPAEFQLLQKSLLGEQAFLLGEAQHAFDGLGR